MKKQRAINLLVLIVAIVLLFTVGCFDEESTVVNANEITAFEMTDWVFGETPSTPSVTATYGADTAKFYYATAEDGDYTEITDFSSLKPNTYYLKAVIEKTSNYAAAEKITSFEVKKHSVHTAVGEWLEDEENHWKLCACGERTDVAAHVSDGITHYSDDKTEEYNECSVCGAKMNETAHEHTAKDDNYEKDGENHWKLCACGEKVGETAHVSDDEVHYNEDKSKEYNECSVCGAKMNETDHEHTATGEYLKDEENHWKLCACGEKVGETAHVSDDEVHYNEDKSKEYNECSVCGAKMNETDHEHAAAGEYLKDEENHWKLCACGEIVGATAHTSDDTVHYDVENMKEYNLCAECGARMNETEHIHDYATTANDDGNYACACGVAVNPFNGLAKYDVVFYDNTIVSKSEQTVFGSSKFTASDVESGETSFGCADGQGKGFLASAYYKKYYFAIKVNKDAKFTDTPAGQYVMAANNWYIVKVENSNGTLSLYIKGVDQTDDKYVNTVMGSWRLNSSGEARFNYFMRITTNSGENYNLEISEIYAEEINFSANFNGMTKVADSALNDKATLSHDKIGENEVYVRKDIITTDTTNQDFGSTYDIFFAGEYTEYRFAIKITEEFCPVVWNDGANSLKANSWYVIKLEKRTGENARGWNVFVKRADLGDEAFTQIPVDDWTIGNHDAYQGNTRLQYFLNIYTLESWDKVFDAYATGIWAK